MKKILSDVSQPALLALRRAGWHRVMLISLFFSSFSFAALGQAKEWDKTFGREFMGIYDEATFSTMIATPDGGYLLGGSSKLNAQGDKSQPSRGETDYWVVKIDTAGNKLWDKTFGGSSDDNLEAIVATADGGYLLGGYTHSGSSGDKSQPNRGSGDCANSYCTADYWIVKIDAQGNLLWEKTIGGNNQDFLSAIIATPDGGYLLGGYSSSDISGDKSEANRNGALYSGDPFVSTTHDYWVIKIDDNGNKLWDKTFGGKDDDTFTALILATDGGYVLGGYSDSGQSGDKSQPNRGVRDYWVLKISSSGQKVWDKTIGGNQDDILSTMINTPDGNYLLGGSSYSDPSGEKSQTKRGGWVIKLNKNGDLLWEKIFGGAYGGRISAITANADGYLLGGGAGGLGNDNTEVSRGETDYWVLQITADGTTKRWDKTYGGSEYDLLETILPVAGGGYLLGGTSNSWTGFEKSDDKLGYWIIKIKDQSKKGQTITFPTILNKTAAEAPFALPEKASSGLPITYTIVSGPATVNGNILTLTGAGTVTVKASQAGNATYLAAPDVTRSFIVDRPSPVTKLWDKTIGGDSQDLPSAVVATPDGGYLLGGFSGFGTGGDKTQANKGESDFWVVKVAADGTKVWDKTYNGMRGEGSDANAFERGVSRLTAMVAAPGGGYVLGGYSNAVKGNDKTADGRGGQDYWVVKIDENGNKLWDQTFGGPANDFLTDLIVTSDGNYLVGGISFSGNSGDKTEASRGGTDYWVVKLSATGTKLWDKTYGGPADESQPNFEYQFYKNTGLSLANTPDNGYLVAGTSFSGIGGDKSQASRDTTPFSAQRGDYWVVKINDSGAKVWDKTLGGRFADHLTAVVATPDGGYLLGGTSQSDISGDKSAPGKGNHESDGNYFGSDYWVIKIDGAGAKIWDQTFGGEKYTYSELIAMTVTADGNYLLGGNSYSNIANDKSEVKRNPEYYGDDFWLVKIGPEGNKLWDKTYGGVKDADYEEPESLTALLADADGSYVAAGFSYRNRGGDKSEDNRGGYDYWVIKFQDITTPPVTAARNWRFGGSATDRFTVVIKTKDGGYLSGGYSNSPISGDKSQASKGGADYWLVKTDQNGKKQWDRTYGGPGDDYLNRIIATTDGGYLLAGSSTSNAGGDKTEASRGEQDYWLVKITNDGTQQWNRTYGGSGFDDLRKVNQLANGDYLLAGTSNSPVSGDKSQASRGGADYWVLRVSSTGTKIWDQRYGGTGNDNLESFTKTSDGGFLLAGSSASGKNGDKTQASKGGQDYWLVKINAQGAKIWDRTYGGTGDDELYSVGRTTTGEFFVAGHSSSDQSGNKTQASQGGSDYWMLKLSSTGTKLWDKSFGGNQDETLRSVIQTEDGGYILAGSSASGTSGDKTQASQGSTDYWLVKTDSSGAKQSDQRFGGAGTEELRYIEHTADGGYLLGGRSDSGASGDRTQPSQGGTDYWLVKVAPVTATTATLAAAANPAPAVVVSNGLQAYPNPFSDRVTTAFTFTKSQAVSVKVYNSQGREVATLYQGPAQAGKAYTFEWQPAVHQPNGVYIIRLQTATRISHHKVLLTR